MIVLPALFFLVGFCIGAVLYEAVKYRILYRRDTEVLARLQRDYHKGFRP